MKKEIRQRAARAAAFRGLVPKVPWELGWEKETVREWCSVAEEGIAYCCGLGVCVLAFRWWKKSLEWWQSEKRHRWWLGHQSGALMRKIQDLKKEGQRDPSSLQPWEDTLRGTIYQLQKEFWSDSKSTIHWIVDFSDSRSMSIEFL